MTNKGLNITPPIIEERNIPTKAVLACRYEDNFSGPIAIALSRVQAQADDVYSVSYFGARTYIVNLQRAQAAERRSIIIRRETSEAMFMKGFGLSRQRRINISTATILWVRTMRKSSGAYMGIDKITPSEFWNPSSSTFRIPGGRYQGRCAVHIHISDYRSPGPWGNQHDKQVSFRES
jgi:hypothetical protein